MFWVTREVSKEMRGKQKRKKQERGNLGSEEEEYEEKRGR